MILMMARLGLRSPEIIAIRLEDVDWRLGPSLSTTPVPLWAIVELETPLRG